TRPPTPWWPTSRSTWRAPERPSRLPDGWHGPLQALPRVRRDALQRLAGPEERAHGPGGAAARDPRGAGARGPRGLRLGPHRRRRACPRPGSPRRPGDEARLRRAALRPERPSARGHQRGLGRARVTEVPRPPRGPGAQLPVPDLAAADRS